MYYMYPTGSKHAHVLRAGALIKYSYRWGRTVKSSSEKDMKTRQSPGDAQST